MGRCNIWWPRIFCVWHLKPQPWWSKAIREVTASKSLIKVYKFGICGWKNSLVSGCVSSRAREKKTERERDLAGCVTCVIFAKSRQF